MAWRGKARRVQSEVQLGRVLIGLSHSLKSRSEGNQIVASVKPNCAEQGHVAGNRMN